MTAQENQALLKAANDCCSKKAKISANFSAM